MTLRSSGRWWIRALVLGVCLHTLQVEVRAESAAQDPWKQDMERKLDALTREVERNKLGEAAATAPPDYKSERGYGPAASKAYRVNRGVSIGGYGEMLLQAPNKEKDDGTPSGRKRTLDFLRAVLYAGYKFNDKIVFNSEIEFEHATTGEGSEEKGEVSVEFAQIDFLLSQPLGVRAGLMLVPMGFINEMHEPTTFHGALRPSVETQIIPSTWRENGAGLFGDIGPVSYRTYLMAGLSGVEGNSDGFSSGSAIRGGRTAGSQSSAEDVAWVGRVDYHGIPGVLLGVSGYTGQAGQNDTTASDEEIDAPVSLWESHASAEYRGLELRALFAQGSIRDVSQLNDANSLTGSNSIGEKFFGGYTQIAYNVLSVMKTNQYLAPFFLYERYDTQQRVPEGFTKNPANSRTEYTVGLTYKPITQVVVKADWQNKDNQAGTGVNQCNLALGYIF